MDYLKVIQDELSSNGGDLRKACRALGFNYSAAQQRLSDEVSTKFDLGRPEMRKYIVAYRHVSRDWPYQSREDLADARRKHDAGTHEMCQGRDAEWIIQYLIPRIVPCARRRVFSYEQ